MSRDQLAQYVYTTLLSEFPDIAQTQLAHMSRITTFINDFLAMYPAHETEITPEEQHHYQYREIALFTISEFTQFLNKKQADSFSIQHSISRFLFARHASLVALRTRISHDQLYPIHQLDTTEFTHNEHTSLVLKLTFCHVSSLSLRMLKTPSSIIMDCYAQALQAEKIGRRINPTLKKIEFFGLDCNVKNDSFIHQLLKNTKPIQISIILPEWDKAPHSDQKAAYYCLQNHIRDNQKALAITRSKGARSAVFTLSDLLSPTQQFSPETFLGDHHQFAQFAPETPNAWPFFDFFMATRTNPTPIFEEEAFKEFLNYLHTWAIQQGMDLICAQTLFANSRTFTPNNAKALGQLFNSMDSQQEGPVGTQRWIHLVNIIWRSLGAEHFFVWKTCVLDRSDHWLNCVEAITPVLRTPHSPSRFRLTPLTHFQSSWFELIKLQISRPNLLQDDPNLILYVTTLLKKSHQILLFGTENADLQLFFSMLSRASNQWIDFFQTSRDTPMLTYIPCRQWVAILKEEETITLQILDYFPYFENIFHDIHDIELCSLGMSTLMKAIKEKKTHSEVLIRIQTAHSAARAYQHFIWNRSPILWQSQLAKESIDWCAAYFELLNQVKYKIVDEQIIETTLYADDLQEVQEMLELGRIIAFSNKSLDPMFLQWIARLLQVPQSPTKQAFLAHLFSQATDRGFKLDLRDLAQLWQWWVTQRSAEPKVLLYLAQTNLDLHHLSTQSEFQIYIQSAQRRQSLMSALSQGVLPISKALRTQCYQWYRACLQRLFIWVEWASEALGCRERLYRQAYEILNHLIQDLRFARSHSERSKPFTDTHDLQAHYTPLFQDYQQTYSGFFWSCNRQRIQQAQDLFRALQSVATPNKQAFYEQMLTILIQQQFAIYNADQTYYLYASNTKGYSRLYDICTELFLTISHDCLCDPDLLESEKSFVSALLEKQFQNHLLLLSPYLPDLKRWQTKEINLETFHAYITEHKAQIPPYLHRSLMTMSFNPTENLKPSFSS